MAELPITPYALIEFYTSNRERRKQELICAINSFLKRQARTLVRQGYIDYMDITWGEEDDLLVEVIDFFRDSDWIVARQVDGIALRFRLPGTMIGNGNGHQAESAV